ncbi:MAG: amine oxidase [Halobacteriovorax sp.]|nr:amine oxidase [Halobacteriovorax sp.]
MAKTPKHTSILFIGAGPTTIGACYRLRDLGETDYFVIEQGDKFGGLSRSFVDEKGFTWDLGGHVQFSHYEEFDKAMDEACKEEGWLGHQRESWVWINQEFVPYPFQYNFQLLDKATTDRCLKGLELRTLSANPSNFKQWLSREFGEGLCDLFMYPYNFKVWAHPPELMNHEWISERVATIDMSRIKKNIESKNLDVSWGPNATFRFPAQGGTGRIWENLGAKTIEDRVLFNTRVVSISAKFKIATLSDGSEITYDKLFSTMPLDRLCHMIEDKELEQVKHSTAKLPHSSTHVIGFGIDGQPPENLRGKCWMYFPQDNSPYYRVTLFSHYAPANVPRPGEQYSLMVEVSESNHKKVGDDLIAECLNALIQDELLLDSKRVISTWSTRLEYGYPVPGLERNAIVLPTHKSLQPFDIYSRGRFGHWHYEVSNQDHSFMQGHEWIDWVFNGKEEETIWKK